MTSVASTTPARGVTATLHAPAMPGTVWLVRHAATSWTGRRWCGRADPPLTAAGQRAARELGTRLAPELPVDTVVLASPARRARATAQAIVRATGSALEPLIVDDLVEVDVGRAEGLTWTQLSDREPALATTFADGRPVDWPGGEGAAAVAARAERMASRIRALGEVPAVVVSHGAFLHALAIALIGSSGTDDALVPLAPCGVHRLEP